VPEGTTRVCKDGVDEQGSKCNCKDISGCVSCTIALRGDIRTEVCLACEAGRFSVAGKCPKTMRCQGGKLEGNDTPCSCGAKTCHACTVSQDESTPPRCLTCKKSTYYHEGQCLDSCPEGLAHVGKLTSQYGRSCQSAHTCVKGVVTTEGHPRQGKSCRCHSRDCLDCEFHADTAGVNASCTRCTNKLFHQEGECVEACPSHLTHHGLKKAGRSCVAPFSCSVADQKAGACHCHKTCKGCVWEAANTPKVHSCAACRSKKKQPGADGHC